MIDYGLKGRVALITGANNPQGIGAATALAFAREGAEVCPPSVYNNTAAAQELSLKAAGVHISHYSHHTWPAI